MDHATMSLFPGNVSPCSAPPARGLEASASSQSHPLLVGAGVPWEGIQGGTSCSTLCVFHLSGIHRKSPSLPAVTHLAYAMLSLDFLMQ